jgi:hypothetical protein
MYTKLAPGTPIEVWFQDEMRVGQKNKLTYRWARKGSRPRAIPHQRTQSSYPFGAVCRERGAGATRGLLLLRAGNAQHSALQPGQTVRRADSEGRRCRQDHDRCCACAGVSLQCIALPEAARMVLISRTLALGNVPA